MTICFFSDYNKNNCWGPLKKRLRIDTKKCSDREEYLVAQSKERGWLVKIFLSAPVEVALEQ